MLLSEYLSVEEQQNEIASSFPDFASCCRNEHSTVSSSEGDSTTRQKICGV